MEGRKNRYRENLRENHVEERKINTTARKIIMHPGTQARAGLQVQEELLIFLP